MAKHTAVRREENGIEETKFLVTDSCLGLVKMAGYQKFVLLK